MAHVPTEPPFASPITPPMHPAGPPSFARETNWSMVLGIIAIVLGVLGILGGCWAGFGFAIMEAMFDAAPGGPIAGMEIIREWRGWTLASASGSTILAALLLAAGIGLCRRRRWAVTACWWWAIVKFILVAVNLAVMMRLQHAQIAAFSPPSGGALPPGFTVLMSAIGVAIGLIWGWALPGFLVVWFRRETIRREISEWC